MDYKKLIKIFNQRKSKLEVLGNSKQLSASRTNRIKGGIEEIDFLLCTLKQYDEKQKGHSDDVGSSVNAIVRQERKPLVKKLRNIFNGKSQDTTRDFILREESYRQRT